MFALFDLDDTLHDKSKSLRASAHAMHTAFLSHHDVTIEAFVATFVSENNIIQPKAKVFKTLANHYGFDVHLESAMLDFFDTQFHTFSKCFDQVEQTLNFLKEEKVRLACITNGRDFFQRNKLDALGLTQYFDLILTSGEFGVKKPDPIIFKHALEQLNADAKDCVFIGDSLSSDMAPAKALGMTTVWTKLSKQALPTKSDNVDYVLESYSDFESIWQQLMLKPHV